jgi:hypothetical protein
MKNAHLSKKSEEHLSPELRRGIYYTRDAAGQLVVCNELDTACREQDLKRQRVLYKIAAVLLVTAVVLFSLYICS